MEYVIQTRVVELGGKVVGSWEEQREGAQGKEMDRERGWQDVNNAKQ